MLKAGLLVAALLTPESGFAAEAQDRAGRVTVPISSLASPEARRESEARDAPAGRIRAAELSAAMAAANGDIPRMREVLDRLWFKPGLARMRETFDVKIEPAKLAGVQVDIVTPAAGIRSTNAHRVLINLHGGSMQFGARYSGQQESVPIAALGGYKVVTVDYRMAPEHRFPAASEDVAAIYAELLKSYRPDNIGIYGCSSGANLTAQAVVWFQAHGLPRPGAIGMFGSGAGLTDLGDSFLISKALSGESIAGIKKTTTPSAYREGADEKDPLVTPGFSRAILASFPPSLLISGTRDQGLSPTAYSHSQLVDVGVDADLHVWEGAGHCSFAQGDVDPHIPENQQAWKVIATFFDKWLGKGTQEAARTSK